MVCVQANSIKENASLAMPFSMLMIKLHARYWELCPSNMKGTSADKRTDQKPLELSRPVKAALKKAAR